MVFGGFSAEALAGRLIDAKSTVVLTANGVMRGAKPIGLFDIVNNAATICEEGERRPVSAAPSAHEQDPMSA